MPLTGSEKKKLTAALTDAFRTRDTLKVMLSFECDQNLDVLAGTGGLLVVVPEVVEAADAGGWIDQLLAGALKANPGNPSLRALHDRAWPTNDPDLPELSVLQSLIEPSLQFLDIDVWLEAAQEMSRRVCRVRASSATRTKWGTGFLVGPSSILTNQHVVGHLDQRALPDLTCQFGYRVRPGGTTNDGVTLGPATDGDGWLAISSPPSAHDEEVVPSGLPTDEELDYALVRIDGNPGADLGWVDLSDTPSTVVGQPLAILQHPDKAPLKLALDTKAILGINANGTRVTYRTNTLRGSSGSPCFNMDWLPVALHHVGDPSAPLGAPRNAGIPLGAITAHIARHGHAGDLGSP